MPSALSLWPVTTARFPVKSTPSSTSSVVELALNRGLGIGREHPTGRWCANGSEGVAPEGVSSALGEPPLWK